MLMDTEQIPSSSPIEINKFGVLIQAAKIQIEPEQHRIKKKYIETETPKLVEAATKAGVGLAIAAAKKTVQARCEGGKHRDLFKDDVIVFDKFGPVIVGDVLKDLKKYDQATLCDPQETELGRNKAKLYFNKKEQKPCIHSHAHGGIKYFLHKESATDGFIKDRDLGKELLAGVTRRTLSKREITYLSGADIIAKPMEIEWLIVGLFSMNESVLIHAAGGIGKSMFVLFLVIILASFRNNLEDSLNGFLGDFVIPQKRATLIMGSENGRVTTYQRLKLMCKGSSSFEEGLKNIFFLSQYDDTTITGEVFLDESFCDFLVEYIQLIEHEQNVKIDILVIDPLISFTGASDENNSADMRPALDAIDRVCKQVKCTPIVIHHDKKDGDNYRGSTAINDWTRNRISLKREFIAENRITDIDVNGKVTGQRVAQIPVIRVRHEKSNNFKMFDPFLIRMTRHLHFERVEEQMTPEEAEKANTVTQALTDMGGYAESTNALANVYMDLAGLGKTAAKNHISMAVDNGFIERKSAIIKGKQTYEYYSVENQ
ncbi:AAA family ATPase [Desulfobacula sp.]|uniref:AAA family ATPase n=1 Tax=Desulfobacula sp. TaxID=2593537 RepID=UPI0026174D17|nr:AAA family ATPase [Desulfobacula sp.]